MKPATDAAVVTEHKRPKDNLLRKFGRLVDHGLTTFFGTIAAWVATRPYLVFWGMIGLAVLAAAGIARIKVLSDSEDLYTPQGTEGFTDRNYVDALYGYPQIQNNIYATAPGRSGANILTKAALLSLLGLWENMTSTTVYYGTEPLLWNSSNVCYRPGGPTGGCDVVSVLDYWKYSAAAIEADPDLYATVSNTAATDSLGRSLAQDEVMSFTKGPSGNVTYVTAFSITFFVQNNKGGDGSSKRDKVTDAWEDGTVDNARFYPTSSLEFFPLFDSSVNTESSNAISADISLLIIGYVLLIVYGLIVLSKRQVVESRSVLALANVGSIALGVLATYGLVILCGVGFSLVVQVLALLLLGLGTDDMLVTMAAHEETGRELGPDAPIVDRVRATVSRARRGIVIASLTNFVAFCTGISASLPALSDFMIFAAVGITIVVIYQSTFFVACITLDLRRQRARKIDILCCRTSKTSPTTACFGGEYNADSPSISQRIIGIWLPKLLLNPIGKSVVAIIAIWFLVMGIIGCIKVKENFNDEWFIPSSSYISDVYKVRDQYFTSSLGIGSINFAIYTKNPGSPIVTDYFDYQSELLAIYTDLQASPYVTSYPPVQSWYVSYIAWLPTSIYKNNLTSANQPATSAVFYAGLREFLLSGDGQRFNKSVVFSNTSANIIESTATTAFTISLPESYEQVNGMRNVRAIASTAAPDLDAIAYADPFLFYEGYAVIESDTVQAILIAGSIVFVICLVMLADIVTSIAVGIQVVLVDIELVGFMYWAGLSFNSVTAINLLVAIGVAVDYSAFTAFSFMTKIGTRNSRAKQALNHFGVAVFNGGFTLFLAILPAAGATSYIFQTFFKMFAMIVALGLFHGLLVLPVILSFIGSAPYDSAYDRAEQQAVAGKVTPVGQTDGVPAPAAVQTEGVSAPGQGPQQENMML